jgi:hypothetical protein
MPNHLKFETPDGQAHEALMVHASGQPGAVVLDRLTGVILTPIMDRPDWADGLAVALLEEHRQFYTSRTGRYNEPELFELSDLGWVGVNERGEEIEVDAIAEYRMDILATTYGMDREDGDMGEALAEAEIAMDHHRTPEEEGAMEQAGATLERKAAL